MQHPEYINEDMSLIIDDTSTTYRRYNFKIKNVEFFFPKRNMNNDTSIYYYMLHNLLLNVYRKKCYKYPNFTKRRESYLNNV